MEATNALFYVLILIMSVVIHEVCHGFMAEYFGDHTARHAGRLTINPLPHLDLFGSIILPLVLYISTFKTGHPFLFGWAKPVPYNPDNLSNKRWGTLWVALAGVLANFCLAIIFGLVIRMTLPYAFSNNFYFIISEIVAVNLALGVFNLIPLPPLDGSKILFAFLPYRAASYLAQYERYSFILLLVFIVYFSDFLSPLILFLFRLLTGIAF